MNFRVSILKLFFNYITRQPLAFSYQVSIISKRMAIVTVTLCCLILCCTTHIYHYQSIFCLPFPDFRKVMFHYAWYKQLAAMVPS